MEKKDKNILKKGLLETSPNFTSNLMDQINAEEKALSTVLSTSGKLETSSDFTAQLMAQLEGTSPAMVYSPVISKRIWYVLATLFVAVIGLAVFFGNGGAKGRINLNLSNITDRFESFFQMNSSMLYLVFAVLVFSIGLVVEQRIGKKKNIIS